MTSSVMSGSCRDSQVAWSGRSGWRAHSNSTPENMEPAAGRRLKNEMPPPSKRGKPEVSVYILAAFGIVLIGDIFVLTVIARGMATGSFYRNAEGKIVAP